ncbi:hypothetical protein WMF38_41210 [Sorangium sp. So ce118]
MTEFEGRRLWATNRAHLSFLIKWLSTGGALPKHGHVDRSYLEALPKWLRARKDRAEILKRLHRLQGDGDV